MSTMPATTTPATPAGPAAVVDLWAAALRASGRRVTKQRIAVLHAIQQHPHQDADSI